MFCDCKCYVALPGGAMGWSTVCDCGISRSYSLPFFYPDELASEEENWLGSTVFRLG